MSQSNYKQLPTKKLKIIGVYCSTYPNSLTRFTSYLDDLLKNISNKETTVIDCAVNINLPVPDNIERVFVCEV